MPRGGARVGAGRPHLYHEPRAKKTVTLPYCYKLKLESFGEGNLSEGIRALVGHA